jgi:hypothetical protein
MTLKTYATVFESTGGKALRLDPADRQVYDKILAKATETGKRIRISIQTETAKDNTMKQQGLYFALLGILWKIANHESRNPTQEEKLELHEEMKSLHGYRRPSKLHPEKLVPIGVSESDTEDMGALIDGVYLELWSLDLTLTQQSEARDLWVKYWELGGPRWTSVEDFRERSHLCAGCGSGDIIQLAHIRSRGASKAQEMDPNNWLPLCPKCHTGTQHQKGWGEFLKLYPHLEKRVKEVLGGSL